MISRLYSRTLAVAAHRHGGLGGARDDAFDRDIFVLNKPSGFAVQGGTKTTHHLDRLLEGLGDGPKSRLRLVHRLDRDTSGVIVVARTEEAHHALAKQVQVQHKELDDRTRG